MIGCHHHYSFPADIGFDGSLNGSDLDGKLFQAAKTSGWLGKLALSNTRLFCKFGIRGWNGWNLKQAMLTFQKEIKPPGDRTVKKYNGITLLQPFLPGPGRRFLVVFKREVSWLPVDLSGYSCGTALESLFLQITSFPLPNNFQKISLLNEIKCSFEM
jgi:hypothetical protein